MSDGQWFVRFAGRVTGPFDTERVRTMARRGALTPLHFLSSDRRTWTAASRIPGIFDSAGPASPHRAAPREGGAVDLGIDVLGEGDALPALPQPQRSAALPVPPPVVAAVAAATPAGRLVAVGPVKVAAVALVALAVAVSALGALPDMPGWMSPGAGVERRLVVRVLQAIAMLAGIVACALGPGRGLSAATAAVSCVVACASALDAAELPWAPASLLLAPLAAVLCALVEPGGAAVRPVAAFATIVAPIGGAVTAWLATRGGTDHPVVSGILAGLAAAGGASIAVGGFLAMRGNGPRTPWVFPAAAGGTALVTGATLVGALALGLGGAAREIAADACIALAASGMAWAGILGAHPQPPHAAARPGRPLPS